MFDFGSGRAEAGRLEWGEGAQPKGKRKGRRDHFLTREPGQVLVDRQESTCPLSMSQHRHGSETLWPGCCYCSFLCKDNGTNSGGLNFSLVTTQGCGPGKGLLICSSFQELVKEAAGRKQGVASDGQGKDFP